MPNILISVSKIVLHFYLILWVKKAGVSTRMVIEKSKKKVSKKNEREKSSRER